MNKLFDHKNLKPFVLLFTFGFYVILVLKVGVSGIITLPIFLIFITTVSIQKGRFEILTFLLLLIAVYILALLSLLSGNLLILILASPLVLYYFLYLKNNKEDLKNWFLVLYVLMVLFSMVHLNIYKYFTVDCYELLIENSGEGMTQAERETCKNMY